MNKLTKLIEENEWEEAMAGYTCCVVGEESTLYPRVSLNREERHYYNWWGRRLTEVLYEVSTNNRIVLKGTAAQSYYDKLLLKIKLSREKEMSELKQEYLGKE